MNNKKASWGKISTTPKTVHKCVASKAASSGWTRDRLTPKEIKKTQVNTVSYSGMTVIFRHGKK